MEILIEANVQSFNLTNICLNTKQAGVEKCQAQEQFDLPILEVFIANRVWGKKHIRVHTTTQGK